MSFTTAHLTGDALKAARIIERALTRATAAHGQKPYAGGQQSFWDPAVWAVDHDGGARSLLVVVHDGGSLSRYPEVYWAAVNKALHKQGYWVEQINGAVSAVYRS